MKPILRYILLTAMRDWLYVGLLIVLIAAFGVSSLLGSTALVEQSQMTIVYIAGSSRMIIVLGMILFVCFHVHRSFENKEVEFILSKSISRHKFIFSYLLGFIIVTSIIILPLGIALFFMVPSKTGLLIWLGNLILEILITITFALLATLILKRAVSAVLASLGFYILARMMGFFVLTINIPKASYDFNTSTKIMQAILKFLSALFPRIDLFSQSEWLIYGISNLNNLNIILLQSAIYIPLMIFMAFRDFNKKQF